MPLHRAKESRANDGRSKTKLEIRSGMTKKDQGFGMIHVVGGLEHECYFSIYSHRIHGAGKHKGGILMVNVTIYSIHGSYGIGNNHPN